jgi:2-polyprenyl-6-methoxyphenol hydroxylase-like FAD-dependent oxidoreductase
MSRPIVIVGGGLAGLTLGIGLRRHGVPVAVWESGGYPRHRVCGEFISGRGQSVLAKLGLRERVEQAGAFRAETATFIARPRDARVHRLPSPALCLSRYLLDDLLADEFQKCGGELRENSPWREGPADGVVHATGRRAQPTDDGWRWFGLKVHARNVQPMADLEMHLSSSSYVGVNRIDHGAVNVCGLFRARPGDGRPESKFDLLRGRPGSTLHERLANAEFEPDSFCSVAGLSLKPQRAADRDECCIGDAITMIPPATGNGMSMAFESAALAIEPAADYSRGEITWAEARRRIAAACDAAFGRRLAWARRLQWLMFAPFVRTPFGAGLLRSEWLWRLMFVRTR